MPDEPTPQRLGRRQLGRHAYEKHMPKRVHAIAAEETPQNTVTGVIPILAQLLDQDTGVERACLCNDAAEHVFKVKGEGDHFCGYRNIQMLLRVWDKTHRHSILELQALIENAWDKGFNSAARVETGGIVDTRKHIGTAEVQALLESLNIPCTANAISNMTKSKTAYQDLLDSVEQYFSTKGETGGQGGKVTQTMLSPIYLQRPRHSLTIVGIERRRDGSRSLLVFDPAYDPPADLQTVIPTGTEKRQSKSILKAYRRDERYLRRYRAFETLYIDTVPAAKP